MAPLCAAVLLCLLHMAAALSREPIFYGDYGIEAAANLSAYRSNFLATVMPLFDDEKKVWYDKQSGHERWEHFYKTHITCPPGERRGNGAAHAPAPTRSWLGPGSPGGDSHCLLPWPPPCLISRPRRPISQRPSAAAPLPHRPRPAARRPLWGRRQVDVLKASAAARPMRHLLAGVPW